MTMAIDSYEDLVFEIFGRGIKNTIKLIKLKKTIFTSGTFVLNLKEVNKHK